MKPDKSDKKINELISRAIGRQRPTFDFNKWQADHQKEIQTYKAQVKKPSDSVESSEIWRKIMKSPITKLAAAAVIIITILGGINFWPDSPGNRKWWLDPSAAWGQEIIQSLEKVKTLVYRQRVASVSDYGNAKMGVGWEQRFCSENAYRRDSYDWRDGTTVINTQWVLREPDGRTKYEVSYEYQCYFQDKTGGRFYSDQMDSFRWYVGLLHKADRILETKFFEGRECVGFEINAGKYGDNPESQFNRIWFDVETKLPARIEKHGHRSSFDAAQAHTVIHDQFEYYTEVPADIFTPQIPQDFVNAHPDEIRDARKGQMTFADVPEGLKDQIVAAMKKAKTMVYQQGDMTVYSSPNAWRYDYYSADRLQKSEWYVSEQYDTGETGFEIEDKVLRVVRTTVDFDSRTYRISGYISSRHPMHEIVFFAGLVDRADRILENRIIDEVECIGFEISAKKYGDNPESMIHRLWFDADTKLLVRMEFEWETDKPSKQNLKQQFQRGQFQWDSDLPADTFTPAIPEGFGTPTKKVQ
ncbi:MAG: hypothetical protein FVQ85_08005 [Planctomycetes bacterium]|nr:hypothetical protein [Planctomycetota bacterium]